MKKSHAVVKEKRSKNKRSGRGRKIKDESKIPAAKNTAKKRKGYVMPF
jgi:hypothetical protein